MGLGESQQSLAIGKGQLEQAGEFVRTASASCGDAIDTIGDTVRRLAGARIALDEIGSAVGRAGTLTSSSTENCTTALGALQAGYGDIDTDDKRIAVGATRMALQTLSDQQDESYLGFQQLAGAAQEDIAAAQNHIDEVLTRIGFAIGNIEAMGALLLSVGGQGFIDRLKTKLKGDPTEAGIIPTAIAAVDRTLKNPNI